MTVVDRVVLISKSRRLASLAPHTTWLFRLGQRILELTEAGNDFINLGVSDPDQPTDSIGAAAG
jgi:hypothetical protein